MMGEGPLCNLASTICEESFINLNDENDVSDDGSLAEDQISERSMSHYNLSNVSHTANVLVE